MNFWFLAACAHKPAPPAVPTPAEAYAAAVDDASHPEEGELHALLSLPREPRVLVTTWTRSAYYADPKYQPDYAFPLYGETWFTAGDEVAAACEGLTGQALAARVEQLLGLPPDGGRDAFLQLWIDPGLLFRPCTDPDVYSEGCARFEAPPSCGPESSPHEQWLCQTWKARYGAEDPLQRYPWTALGYTFDWGGPDEYGATEFVAHEAAEVTWHALMPNDAFCEASNRGETAD